MNSSNKRMAKSKSFKKKKITLLNRGVVYLFIIETVIKKTQIKNYNRNKNNYKFNNYNRLKDKV